MFTVFFVFSLVGSEAFFCTTFFGFSTGFGFSIGSGLSFCGSSSLGTSTFFSETGESLALLM